VQDILSSSSFLTISVLYISEIISALCGGRRERKLSQQQGLAAKEAPFTDIEDMSVVNLTDPVITRAVDILEKWPLRSSDSLHMASAAEWSARLFISADERQRAAAREYGTSGGGVACRLIGHSFGRCPFFVPSHL
jgi:uncharacterized protein